MKRLIVLLVLGLVLLLALAAPTLGAKGGKVTFDVSLKFGAYEDGEPVKPVTAGGCSSWGGLDVQFLDYVCEGLGIVPSVEPITMGDPPVQLFLIGMAVKRKHGTPHTVSLFFEDPGGGQYESDSILVADIADGEVTKNTSGFTIVVNGSGDVWPYGPKGKVVSIGTVWVGDAVYTSTAP